ncbi:uncharacterized CBS domain-containing protein [Corynebacterium kutscheri]|uniref:Uncharacterized CBS domain-containing protein n=1 Tax=Corynebacterium kutscheri TaxID=35755 RepID=A0AB38VS18_9CORY|nr:uncharacterized CBS domain-containing protein [Corynebacterium kutscheri]VEH79335.1 uncharacterized CBS domain-containing protein [Corynebacterium kutscheri]
MINPFLLGAIVILALLFSGLLGSIEAAVTLISRARVEQIVKEEETRAARSLLRVLDRRAEHINLLVLGRTFLDATAAACGAVLASELMDTSLITAIITAIVAVALMSFAVIGVFSRTVGRKNPYTVSLGSAMILNAVAKVLGPITKLLIRFGNVIAPGAGFRDGPYSTEVELREMVDIAQEHGVVEVEERRMIQSVFDLASTTARSVMVPRPEMVWIESGKTAGQATSLLVRSGHSRVPVIGETVDDILGVVYLKDLVQQTYYSTDGGRSVLVDEIMRKPTFVPDSKNLDALLHEMQSDRNHIAMLVDEYGGIAGLISIEDIIEEIVGEIADEYDEREVAPIKVLSGEDFLVRVVSRLSLEELAEFLRENYDFELDLSEEITDQVDTVGGFLAFEMGRVPLPGSTIEAHGLRLHTEGGRDRRGRLRVNSVLIDIIDSEESQ